MIKNALVSAYRKCLKHRFNTAINIICLSAGMLIFFLTLIYTKHELSYDKFHSRSDRIFRLSVARNGKAGAIVPYTWGVALKNQWFEVEEVATMQNITIALPVKYEDEVYAQHGIIAVDSTFLNIFDFPAVEGNAESFLKDPNKILITPETARKYFGNEDPIGKILEINLWGTGVPFEINGIVKCPKNSHLQFQFIVPFHLVRKHHFNPEAFDSWTTRFAYTYVLLKNKKTYLSDPESVKSYLKDFLEVNAGKAVRNRFIPDLEPLESIYLESDLAFDFPPRGDIDHIKILSLAGFGILIMAMINYINITSAQYLRRLREIGIRKILGSSKINLVVQLLMESMIISIIALAIVYAIILIILPYFNAITGKSFSVINIFDLETSLMLVSICFGLGIISGIYPALLITKFRTVRILNSQTGSMLKTGNTRKFLVIFQFIVAIVLLLGTGVVYLQVDYMLNKELGLDISRVIVLEDARVVASNSRKSELFKNEIIKHRSVHSMVGSSSSPGQLTWADGCTPEGFEGEKVSISTIYADHDYANTYDLKILSGRDLDKNIATDSASVLINEAAMHFFSSKDPEWSTNPLGKKIKTPDRTVSVIGIVKNFHFESLHNEIDPLMIRIDPSTYFNIQIKIDGQNVANSLTSIESTWKTLFPDLPFTYSFADQSYYKAFESDRKLRSILGIFTITSLIIAVLGLFGLTSFESFEKAKEMSIRKVVGATENQLFGLLSWKFLKLVLIANVIALPLGYYFMEQWLASFAYRTEISAFIFIIASTISLAVTLLAIAYHVRKTSRLNPVDVLAGE